MKKILLGWMLLPLVVVNSGNAKVETAVTNQVSGGNATVRTEITNVVNGQETKFESSQPGTIKVHTENGQTTVETSSSVEQPTEKPSQSSIFSLIARVTSWVRQFLRLSS